MSHTSQIKRAIQFAARKHRDHLRRDLEQGLVEAVLIVLADKIDNTEDRIAQFELEGKDSLKKFARGPQAYVEFNAALLSIAERRTPEHRLTKRFAEVHEKERAMLSGL